MNKTVLDALATTGADTAQDNWDTKLVQVQHGLNSTKHRITQYTPAELLFGFSLKTDTDIHDLDDDEVVDVTKIRKKAAK